MKLTQKKVHYIILHKKRGEPSENIGKDMKISKRRVNQVWAEYKEIGKDLQSDTLSAPFLLPAGAGNMQD